MELIIIALIAVEVVIVRRSPSYADILYCQLIFWKQALIRDGPELWHMLVDPETEEKPTHA